MNHNNAAKFGKTKIISCLIFITIFEGFFAKSFIFTGNDQTIIHYGSSAVLVLICFLLSLQKGLSNYLNFFLLIFIFIFLFLGVSTFEKNQSAEYIAYFTFILLIIGFFYSIPILCKNHDINIFEVIYFNIAIFSILSVVMIFFGNEFAYDKESGRFSGALISTAVACNVFSLFTIWSFYKTQAVSKQEKKLIYYFFFVLGFLLLYLTKSRSSIVEAVIGILLLWFAFKLQAASIYVSKPAKWLVPALVAISILGIGFAAISGLFDTSKELQDFRLSDNSIVASRDSNWQFGLERVATKPLFGEGLLTKQTQGGYLSLDVDAGGSYDPRYDPHNLVLSLAVQAGIPFAAAMLFIIFSGLTFFVRTFGISTSLRSPEFVFCSLKTLVMIPAGGDLTSFGNVIDRIYWIILGYLVVTAILGRGAHRTKAIQPLVHRSKTSLT